MRAPSVQMHPRGQAVGAPRRLRYGAIAAAALLLPGAMLPSLSAALLWPIQSRFQRTDLETGPEIAGFIALGGDLDRIDEAVARGQEHPGAKLVVTGEGRLPANYFRQIGIPADRVLIEHAATNTYENAVYTARLLGPDKSRRWILVTSAYHIPRAMGCFRKAGFTVEAWPVPDRTKNWAHRLRRAAHEWVGLLTYWLEGRTDALFPSPPMPPVIATAAVMVSPNRTGDTATP